MIAFDEDVFSFSVVYNLSLVNKWYSNLLLILIVLFSKSKSSFLNPKVSLILNPVNQPI